MTQHDPRLELYVRSLAPTDAREPQERVVERLETLDERGAIAGFDVALCGDCVCPSSVTADTDAGKRLLDRYDAFETWAAERDRDLVGFEHKDTQSLLTDTTVTGIVFPRMTLAEYRGGQLTHVAPSSNGVERTSVLDRLDSY